MPVPDRVQETGTVMLIWSTTLSLSAEAKVEDNTKPEMRVMMIRLPIMYSELLFVCLIVMCDLIYLWL